MFVTIAWTRSNELVHTRINVQMLVPILVCLFVCTSWVVIFLLEAVSTAPLVLFFNSAFTQLQRSASFIPFTLVETPKLLRSRQENPIDLEPHGFVIIFFFIIFKQKIKFT